jgi:hypothetical protein
MNSMPCGVRHRMKERIKILYALDKALSCCSLQYLTTHTNIVHPLVLLEKLEEEGCVYRCGMNDWSTSGHPLFKLKDRPDEVDPNLIQLTRALVTFELRARISTP